MARDLHIFVNRKLISCDTIVPLALELKQRNPATAVRFYVSDHSTANAIRQNRVLYDAICTSGAMIDIGRPRDRARLAHRLENGSTFSALFARTVADRAITLHFKALNDGPLAWLYRLNPGRTYYCESDSYGFTKLMYDVTYHAMKPPPPITRAPNAKRLIAFSAQWPMISAPVCGHLDRFVFGPTRTRKPWLDFVASRADSYFAEEFVRAGVPESREILAVMLGVFHPLPYLRDPQTMGRRLRELLKALVQHGDGRPIFLKPHVVTDLAVLREILAEFPGAPFVISYLHPMVLAQRARLFACNYYSTTVADAAVLGVPTIEYSDYTDAALALTAGGSMRPEFIRHFINDNEAELASVVRTILATPAAAVKKGREGDDSGLLDHMDSVLNGHARH